MIVRGRTLALFAFAALAGAALLHVSQKVGEKERELSRLSASVKKEQEAIKVLQAEWAYLNSPQRLEHLATQYLDMKAPAADHLVTDFAALPQRSLVEASDAPQGVSPLYHNISQNSLSKNLVAPASSPEFLMREGDVAGSVPAEIGGEIIVEGRVPQPGRKPTTPDNFGGLLKSLNRGGE